MACPMEKQLQIEQSGKGRHASSICKAWGRVQVRTACCMSKYLINCAINQRLVFPSRPHTFITSWKAMLRLKFSNHQSTALECEAFCL